MTDAHPPADFEALRREVIARRTQLPKRVAQAAIFAIENADEIAFLTTADIAARAGVQPSTLVRFAQSFGFPGFSDLQQLFRSRLRSRFPDYRERIDALRLAPGGGPSAALLDGFSGAGIASIERLRQAQDIERLDKAVALIAAADTIYLVASRRAFPVTVYLAYAFGKLGLRAVLVDQIAALGPEQLAGSGPRDVALAISYAPYTQATVDLAGLAHAAGVPVIAITDTPFSPLVPVSRTWLEVVEADHGAFRSLSATFVLATTLAVAAAERRAEMAEGDKTRSDGVPHFSLQGEGARRADEGAGEAVPPPSPGSSSHLLPRGRRGRRDT